MNDDVKAMRTYAGARMMIEGMRLVKTGLDEVILSAGEEVEGLTEGMYIEFLKGMRSVEDMANNMLADYWEIEEDEGHEPEKTDGSRMGRMGGTGAGTAHVPLWQG